MNLIICHDPDCAGGQPFFKYNMIRTSKGKRLNLVPTTPSKKRSVTEKKESGKKRRQNGFNNGEGEEYDQHSDTEGDRDRGMFK